MNKLITTDTWDKAQFTIPGGGTYVPPATTMVCVETEGAFCGSIFGPEQGEHDEGLYIQEHGFANPEKPFEIGPTLDDQGEQVGEWEWDK